MERGPDHESSRDERTLDVVTFWLPLAGAGLVIAVLLLSGFASLLGVDPAYVVPVLVVGLPALTTIVFGARLGMSTPSGPG